PADGKALAALGVNDEERREMGKLYKAGQSLWRVAIPHFSVWDLNWPFSPPRDATAPGQPAPRQDVPKDAPALGEGILVVGTPFRLHQHPARPAGSSGTIPLSGKPIPQT